MDQDSEQTIPAQAFRVREAVPADVPALMRFKLLLAEGENAAHAVRASAAHWLRDGFGERAGFCAFVAEEAGAVLGMATCSRRMITGWNGPVIYLQDLFVEKAHRRRGIAGALMARVAAYARDLGSPIIELTVRADNPAAQNFYRQRGFEFLPQCLTYVVGGAELAALAARDRQDEGGARAHTPADQRRVVFATAPPAAPRADPTAA